MQFDIVIPFHEKDYLVFIECVKSVRRFVKGYNRIFVVSNKKTKKLVENLGCCFFDENSIPFLDLTNLKSKWKNEKTINRISWIFQQFLKLSIPLYLTEISENFLCVDSDVIFLREINLYQQANEENIFPYSKALEYHIPYLYTYEKIMNEKPKAKFSFIAHQMFFNRERLKTLSEYIEKHHFNENWIDVIFNSVDYNENSSLSEWDLYGNWMLKTYPELSKNHQLKWCDINHIPSTEEQKALAIQYDYVAAHAWLRS